MANAEGSSSIRGFVAGALSGVAKVSTGHPFDTIKVRLQTSPITRFSGPWSCLCQTLYHDGVRGLYKGMTPPLVGFVFMDSLLLGSFSVYRDFLNRIVQHPKAIAVKDTGRAAPASLGSASVSFIAGGLAGWTVSFIAAPIEHVKARLQVQDGKSKYSSPTDCFRKIYRSHGIPGLYRGLSATIIFRSFFAFFWGSYDILNRTMQSSTSLSVPLINFIAAGIAAQLYWLTGYPTDVIKQRIMTGPLGGVTNDKARRLARWKGVARSIYAESGWRGFWRGFLPCFLRAFPANAMSIVTFEAVMRTTTYAKV